MARKKTAAAEAAPIQIEHATVESLGGKKVKITAEPGYVLRSKHTGHTFPCRVTANPGAWEAVEQ